MIANQVKKVLLGTKQYNIKEYGKGTLGRRALSLPKKAQLKLGFFGQATPSTAEGFIPGKNAWTKS